MGEARNRASRRATRIARERVPTIALSRDSLVLRPAIDRKLASFAGPLLARFLVSREEDRKFILDAIASACFSSPNQLI